MRMKEEQPLVQRFNYEILNRRGTVFLRSARPRTLEEIQADSTLRYMLSQYRHRASTADGQEIENLPGFSHPEEIK